MRLRLARPSDAPLVRDFLGGASDLVVRRFTFYDPRERLVLAATTFEGGVERIVGLADGAVLAQDEELRELLLEAAERSRRRRRAA